MECSGNPALPPNPPRQLCRRRGYSQIVGQYLFLILLVMVTSVFGRIALGTVKLLWFSTRVPAKVSKILVSPGEYGPSYDLLVAYHFGEAEYTSQLTIAPREAERLKEGDHVPVQVLSEQPDRAQLYRQNYPYVFVTVLLCLFTLLPTAGLGRLLWDVYVEPWKLRRLMRDGAVASGRIVDKKEVAGRPPTSALIYAYEVPATSAGGTDRFTPLTIKTSMKVPWNDFAAARMGEEVIILYAPERPGRSVIYRCADYEFLSCASAKNETRAHS
jgi:hypothetical protein